MNQKSFLKFELSDGTTITKNELNNSNQGLQLASIAVAVTGIAFTILGLLKLSVFPLLLGATFLYFSFNVYEIIPLIF